MKVIVSHDVDHLYRSDHYRDLIYPKLWVRSTLELVKREYPFKEWVHRMLSPFHKIRHHIFEVMQYDKEHNIPSSFFFGMDSGLGMSYDCTSAEKVIREVAAGGFDVGVHGISFDDDLKMKSEYDKFSNIVGKKDFGIRMHYVRFSEDTFYKLDKCGYLFDSTEFDKAKGFLLKNPYKIGEMWEFPLVIMDGYLSNKLEDKKRKTLDIIQAAEEVDLKYLTILFHDACFSKAYATERDWYKWIVRLLIDRGYEFISYREAIHELEANNEELI